MLKNRLKCGIIIISLWIFFALNQSIVQATTADTILEIRDHFEEEAAYANLEITDTKITSAIERFYTEEFSVDIYIKNPSQQNIISAQTWLEFDNTRLEVTEIDISNSVFDFVAPGENNFDQDTGLIKIGRSSVSSQTDWEELLVATVSFKVITKYPWTALLNFYEYALDESGYTSVRVMEEGFPVNVLEEEPKTFAILVNQDGIVTETGTSQTTQTSEPPTTTTATTQTMVATTTLARPTGLKATTGYGYVFLIWDEIEDSNLGGYNLYYSSTSGCYLQRRPVGNVNQYEIDNLENGKTYYFAITAYDTSNRETDYSDEIRITVWDLDSASNPILISRDDYLTQVPTQPQNGPAMLILTTLVALFSSFIFLKFKNRFALKA